jgi:alpha-tubulin suppressor-like RCC1 family protein
VTQIVCGAYHTFITTSYDGSVELYGFGFNAHGQLGLNDNGPRRLRIRDTPMSVPLPAGAATKGLRVAAKGHSSFIVAGADE